MRSPSVLAPAIVALTLTWGVTATEVAVAAAPPAAKAPAPKAAPASATVAPAAIAPPTSPEAIKRAACESTWHAQTRHTGKHKAFIAACVAKG